MRKHSSLLCSAVALAALASCDLEVGDLNNPSVDDLENNPTPELVSAAATGLIAGHRTGLAARNGYVSVLGILGRESYLFTASDPRFCSELLTGSLAKGSPFGGNFWVAPYANIRQAHILIGAVDKLATFSPQQRLAVKGFARTFIALDLLRVVVTRDTIGAVIDTDRARDAGPAPLVDKAPALAAVAAHLDEAKAELMVAGPSFPFRLPAGFSSPTDRFDAPDSFLRFNRGLRARVAVYQGDWATALTALDEAFLPSTPITDVAHLNVGPKMDFSPNTGDTVNALFDEEIWVHPDLVDDAKQRGDGKPDDRLTRKTAVPLEKPFEGAGCDVTSGRRFTMYDRTSAQIPLMRVEELLLLRAEARFRSGQKAAAVGDLSVVRTVSGGLAALNAGTISDAEVENELLYNRRYSLMFEGGHRWIDARRIRVSELEEAEPNHVVNLRFPIPQGECDARPNEPRCSLESR